MDSFLDISRALQVVFGIGLVIFVHELGHFIAARLCGVRVEVFSLGFGPRLFGLRRGATLYQVAVIPIGGYVRMAGEERRGDDLPPRSDDLAAKSVGARFFIYSGGVLMNVAFGLIVFPILFAYGVPFPPPVLGDPEPGGPAWHAGLVEGTEVIAVNGDSVYDFTQIPTEVALGGPDSVELLVREPGATGTRTIVLEPERNERAGFYTIGVSPTLERGASGGYVLIVDPDSPAAAAGLEDGDRLLAVVGGLRGLSFLDNLALALASGAAVELEVADASGEGARPTRIVQVVPKVSEVLSDPRVGIRPTLNHVAGIRDAGLVEPLGLRAGDRLLSVDGAPIQRLGDLRRALMAAAGSTARISVSRGDGRFDVGGPIESPEHALLIVDAIALVLDIESTRIIVNPDEPAALAGVVDGDRVLRVNGVPVKVWEDVQKLVGAAARRGERVELRVERLAAGSQSPPTYQVLNLQPAQQPLMIYGLGLKEAQYIYRTSSVAEAIRVGATSSWKFVEDCWLTMKRMLRRDVSSEHLGGPIAIGKISYSFAKGGWAKLFFFLCMLSINLAFINVLPIPVLDGGHLMFLIIEKIKGSPVSDRVLGYSQMVGLVLILSLMVYVTYNDLVRWVFPS
ncbi:MAG: site-2 protease family protein [Planctomycetota bacterium]|nr:site-2 protease family protein [Planctomycetota bacterium]